MQQVISGAMLALKLVSAYFLIVALFALKKPKPIPRANPKTRFACVIAARNEERVIGELVQSLLRQNYPKTLFDIYVMPNNCTDHTALAAIRTGAAILKPRGEVRCKGDALHEAFETLLRKDYDAFCVFDADNVVDADFLSRMNDAFLAGAKVTKGAMRVKNPQDSPLCGCYGLYFTCFDFFLAKNQVEWEKKPMQNKKRREELFLLLCLAAAGVCAGLAFRFAVPLQAQTPQTLPDTKALAEYTQVELNTADADALCTLPGVGPRNAQAILDYRAQYGSFARVEDAAQVPGITQAMVDSWAGQAYVR